MAYLVFMLLSLALALGFYALVCYEGRQGTRLLARERERLDRQVEHIGFIVKHVDLAAFVRAEASRVAAHIGHDLARLSLMAVRVVERLLTRFVRYLRTRHLNDDAMMRTPRESAREFVKTLSSFKEHLETTRPEMPPLQ